MPRPDLIHIIFNGGKSDESQGLVSLRRKKWLFYTWGRFSGHHANNEAGVQTIGITDEDFGLLVRPGDDPDRYTELAIWDHVVELLTHPAFGLDRRLGGDEPPPVELLVVVQGKASERQIRILEKIVGKPATDVSTIGGNTDVLFYARSNCHAAKLAAEVGARIEKLKFVESLTIDPPVR